MISIDINNRKNINIICKYIYSNDIFVGMDKIFFNKNFKIIHNIFCNNKMIIYYHNIYLSKHLINSSNIIFYSFKNIINKTT